MEEKKRRVIKPLLYAHKTNITGEYKFRQTRPPRYEYVFSQEQKKKMSLSLTFVFLFYRNKNTVLFFG